MQKEEIPKPINTMYIPLAESGLIHCQSKRGKK